MSRSSSPLTCSLSPTLPPRGNNITVHWGLSTLTEGISIVPQLHLRIPHTPYLDLSEHASNIAPTWARVLPQHQLELYEPVGQL